jgi:starch synthase (maltosyl-transferring)
MAEPVRCAFSSWYELFPRSASPVPGQHGTFRDAEKIVQSVAEMGFDVLYLPPIHPIGTTHRKGKNNSLKASPDDPGSPWAIGNYDGGHKAIHKQLGTIDDFKNFTDVCRQHGIEPAMDIAFQCSPDHPYIKEHPEWFKWRPDGTIQFAENPPKKYEDIVPFDFETPAWRSLWRELKSVIDYWIDNGIKIFRVDNPHTKSLFFWQWLIREVHRKNPGIIFLAEAFTRPRIMEQLAMAGFSQSYTYFTWRSTKKDFQEYLTELTTTSQRYYFRPNFWPNTPDILPPHLTSGGENAHLIRAILAGTLSSNYGIYGPVYEYGLTTPMPGKEEYIDNEKYEIHHWDWSKYSKIKEVLQRLNKIRKTNSALQRTDNIYFAETSSEHILSYCKKSLTDNNIILVAINLDPYNIHESNVKLPLHKLGIDNGKSFMVSDLLSGDKFEWYGENNYVRLNPYDLPAHIFLVEQDFN